MTMRLQLSRPALKLRVGVRIPAQLVGGDGIAVDKAGGIYTLSVDQVALENMIVAAIEADPSLILSLLGQNVYDITTNGGLTLPSDKSVIALKPGTPSARTITIPDGITRSVRVIDGNYSWSGTNRVRFVSTGLVGNSAYWDGTIAGGGFTFTPLGSGNFHASGVG